MAYISKQYLTVLFVPKIPLEESNQPKWYNSTIRHKIKCLRTSKRQLNRYPNARKKSQVTNLQNETQQLIAQAKTDCETRFVLSYAHTNSNKILRCISSIKGRENYPVNMTFNSNNCVSSD